MAGSFGVELADTLPVTFARLARHHGGVTAVDDGAERATWGELAASARLLALALDERGVGRGDTVTVNLPSGALRIAVDQAALAVGGIGDGDGDSSGWRVDAGGLSCGGGEVTPHPALMAAGRAADRARPDRFEQLVAAIAPGHVAVTIGGDRFTNDQLLWGLRSVKSWLAPMVGAEAGAGAGLDVVVPGGWHDPGRAVLGFWWPLAVGATVHIVDPTTDTPAGIVATLASARPVVAIADPATWASMAAAVRRHPGADRSAARRYLASGRARAAGERLGPVERLARGALEVTWGGRLRRDLGLDRCRSAVSLGRPDEAVRRDLAAVGIDLVVTFLTGGVVGPVTATVPGQPAWSAGSPLPGRTVSIEGGVVVVSGGGVSGGSYRTGRQGRLTADGQLRHTSSR